MKDDIETRLQEFYKLYEACELISKWILESWEWIKEMAELYVQSLDYEPTTPEKIYEYVKHRVMKSQVWNCKPRCIRARTVC